MLPVSLAHRPDVALYEDADAARGGPQLSFFGLRPLAEHRPRGLP